MAGRRKTKAAVTGGKDAKELKKLSQEAAEILKVDGPAIAKKLRRKALNGDLACAQMLAEFADRKPREENGEEGAKEKLGPSLAETWANEPPWEEQKSLPEEAGRASTGGQEPEG